MGQCIGALAGFGHVTGGGVNRFSNKASLQQVAAELQPELAFPLERPDRWPAWRDALRARLSELLGGIPPAAPARPVEVLERHEGPGYVREHIVLRGRDETAIPAVVLTPAAAIAAEAPGPAVLCLHGHGRGKADVVGDLGRGTSEERAANSAWIDLLNYDFARRFAQRGFIVVAPDARGFGERAEGAE